MAEYRRSDRRAERRYPLLEQDNHPVRLVIETDAKSRFPVKLLDVSRCGARFQCPVTFNWESPFKWKFCVPSLHLAIDRLALAQWRDVISPEAWSVGCRFDHPIEDEIIARLSLEGVLDSRRTRREKIRLGVHLRKLSAPDVLPGMLLNVSRGGVCIETEGRFELNERITISFAADSEAALDAQVVWRRQSDDGVVMIGCEYEMQNLDWIQDLQRFVPDALLTSAYGPS